MENRFEHIDIIIAKYLSGEATADELHLLEEWRSLSNENSLEYDKFNEIFQASSSLKTDIPVNTDAAWIKVQASLSKKKKQAKVISIFGKPLQSQFLRIAASIVLVAGLFFSIYRLNDKHSENLTFINSGDSVKVETLPDGSTISINKKSSLAYSTDKFSKKRIVKLRGEAFFDVTHDEENPFTVEAAGLQIVDIGTSFNINANEDNELVIISVITGEVKVTTLNDQSILLVAGDEASFNKTTKTFKKSEQLDLNVNAYANRIFIFENTELSTVIKVLNDVYDIKLISESNAVLSCRITVTFEDEPIQEIAEIIAETLGLQIIKDSNTITFSGDVCK